MLCIKVKRPTLRSRYFAIYGAKLQKIFGKDEYKGTNAFVMPVNKAFAEPNEDRRKIGVTQRKADL